MNEPRDTVVGHALRRLDVPDHAPDFWSRLDAELTAGAPAPADHERDRIPEDEAGGAAEVVELDAVTSRRGRDRRPSRLPVLPVAAAVVAIIALVVGVAVTRPDGAGESQVDMADTTPAPTPDAIDPAPETSTDPATTALAAEELAGEWLTLLRAGEVEAAHALLDDPSQHAMPLEEFRDVATGLAEGAAAFAGDGVSSTVVTVEGPGVQPFRVVTFAGEVEREGMAEFASYPVVVTGEGSDLGVHLTFDGPTIEVDTELMTGSTLSSPLPLVVSETAALWVSYDGRTPEPLDQRGQASIELDVTVAGGAGTHIVTLVAVEGDEITARAYPVMVP